MRRPKVVIKVWWLLVGVAIAAGMMGWRQHQVHQRLRVEHQAKARNYGNMEKLANLGASRTQEQWLAKCREVDRRNREGPFETTGRVRALFLYPYSPDAERQQAEAWRRLRIKHEQAARRPWSPIEPEEDDWDMALINP